MIPISENGAISVAQAQTLKPVNPKTPVAAQALPPNPWLVAAGNMVDAAKQMNVQANRIEKEIANLMQDPAFTQNPYLMSRLQEIRSSGGWACSHFMPETEAFLNAVKQALNANKKK